MRAALPEPMELIWRARQESNPRPDGPKPPALSAELRARASHSNRAENWTRHCATAIRQLDGPPQGDGLIRRFAPRPMYARGGECGTAKLLRDVEGGGIREERQARSSLT